MSTSHLDKFGELLMHEVRDLAIEQWEKTLDGRMVDDLSGHIYSTLSHDQRQKLRSLVPGVVDTTLHYLLSLLDWRDDLSVAVAIEGEVVPDIRKLSDELVSELYGQNSWIARYSEKPEMVV